MPHTLPRSTVLLSIVLCACASAPPPRTTANPSPAAGMVSTTPTRRTENMPEAPPDALGEQPPPTTSAQGVGGSSTADPVQRWLSVIDQDSNALAAGLSECRQICTAAANICTAAREICRLTDASDARCTRARGACADAGQRRDTACAVCPQ